jgi:hypothetical protein
MTEMHKKRLIALKLLEEFKAWNYTRNTLAEQLLISALTRDIITGTEDDVNRLITNIEKKNSQLLMKKLAS